MVDHPEWTEDRKLFANRGHLRAGDRGVDGRAHRRRGPRPRRRVPHPARADRQRRHHPGDRPLRGPRLDRRATHATASSSPARPTASTPLSAPSPPVSASTDPVDDREPCATERQTEWAAVRGAAGARPHGVLGRAAVHARARRCSGPRCSTSSRRRGPTAPACSPACASRSRTGGSSRASSPGSTPNKKSVTLDLATDAGRELLRRLIATCDVIVENNTPRVLEQIGLRRRRRPRHPTRPRHGAHARLRARRAVARQPGVRVRDRGRRRAHLDDRATPTQNPVSPYCVGDSNAGLARAVRAAARARAPPAHRRGRARRGVDGRRRTQRGRRAGRRALGLRRPPRARRQPRPDRRAAEPLPHRRRDDAAIPTWVAIAVATDEQWLALRDALGRPVWAMDPDLDDRRRPPARARRHRRVTSPRGARRAPATRSSTRCGPPACPWPR